MFPVLTRTGKHARKAGDSLLSHGPACVWGATSMVVTLRDLWRSAIAQNYARGTTCVCTDHRGSGPMEECETHGKIKA